MTTMVYAVFGGDERESFLEHLFTSKEVAEEVADRNNKRSGYYHYFVIGKPVHSSYTEDMIRPNDEDYGGGYADDF
jgi:hypothetical protein